MAKKQLDNLAVEEDNLRKGWQWNQRESERVDKARKKAMSESHNLKVSSTSTFVEL